MGGNPHECRVFGWFGDGGTTKNTLFWLLLPQCRDLLDDWSGGASHLPTCCWVDVTLAAPWLRTKGSSRRTDVHVDGRKTSDLKFSTGKVRSAEHKRQSHQRS